MKQAQIGSVTAGPRKYFKKPVSFSVMDVNVDTEKKTAGSGEQRTAQHSLVKIKKNRLNQSKTNLDVIFLFFCFGRKKAVFMPLLPLCCV